MDTPVCSNIVNLSPWMILLVVSVLLVAAMIRKYQKFQEEILEYEMLKNKRKDIEGEIEEIELPDYTRLLMVELALGILAFATALFGFLGSDNINYSFEINQTCIVSHQTIVMYVGTESPSATPLPTEIATEPATSIPTPTIEPTATNTAIPQRFFPLPMLGGEYWSDGYNVGLTTDANSVKIQEFLDNNIPFEIGRQINTPGCPLPSTNDYQLQPNMANPKAVYFLMQAGNGISRYDGDIIGEIELQFLNNNPISQELILGFNIRDWARDKSPSAVVMTVTSDMVEEAWQGAAGGVDSGSIGGMDVLTMEIPASHQGSTLETIILRDTTLENNGTDAPCIHLQAVTVEVME